MPFKLTNNKGSRAMKAYKIKMSEVVLKQASGVFIDTA